ARTHRFAFDDHRARAALAEAAAETRTLEADVVAQDVEQRRGRIDVHGMRGAVDLQVERAHGAGFLKTDHRHASPSAGLSRSCAVWRQLRQKSRIRPPRSG